MVEGRTVLYSSWLPEDSGGAEIIAGIRAELAFEGYSLQAPQSTPTNETTKEERARILQCIEDPEIAGLILMFIGEDENVAQARRLQQSGKAVVFLERIPAKDRNFDFVSVDNTMAARQVVEHLVAQGHRSIAHITTSATISSVNDRLRGYRQALSLSGLSYRPEMVVPHGNDRLGITVPPALLQSLLSLPDPPTAIFAVHDWAAFITMVTAHLMGIRIPQQLAVAGFDGLEIFRQDSTLLTTAEVPFYKLGAQAARLLVDRLAGRLEESVRHVSLEAPLRVRFSTHKETSISLLDESVWRKHLVCAYMMDNLAKPLTIEDLAAVAGVSASTLFQDFQQGGIQSPIRLLFTMRLEQIHWELSHPGPDMTVSSAAAKSGVHHLGRFASAYRKKYGETPSQTLRKSNDLARRYPPPDYRDE